MVRVRILAVGWNRHVTEFEEAGSESAGKSWETRHTDDVLAAAARSPLTLATATYNSELIFWKLETGQPYRYSLWLMLGTARGRGSLSVPTYIYHMHGSQNSWVQPRDKRSLSLYYSCQ